MAYTFRIRFSVENVRINIGVEEEVVYLPCKNGTEIFLRSHKRGESLKFSTNLLLKGEGFQSEEEAWQIGEESRDRLSLAFAHMLLPADFGDRKGQGKFYKYGLDMLKGDSDSNILNDLQGLQVYKTDLKPQFAAFNMKAVVGVSKDNFLNNLNKAFAIEYKSDEKKRLSFELLSAAIVNTYIDARFILLMMAIETMIEQKSRSQLELEHIQQLIELTKKADLKSKESIVGGLNNLSKESVLSAGRRMAEELKDSFMGMTAGKFFTLCYNMRSQLIHGNLPRPTMEEVGNLTGELERFTSNLICMPHFKREL